MPKAWSAAPVWLTAPVGPAGTLRVLFHIDDKGHLTSTEPVGDNPPKLLVDMVNRTTPLLQAGTFALKDKNVSAGTTTLEIKVIVSDEAGGDGASGGHEKLHSEYEGGKGTAYFTQSNGRRVDVTVRVVKVEVSP